MPAKSRNRGSAIAREVGLYLLLAVGITALMAGFTGLSGWRRTAIAYAVNTLVSVGIGSSLGLLYRRLLPAIGLQLDRQPGTFKLLLHVVVVAAAILAGVLIPLTLLQAVIPEAMRDFPNVTVLRVAVPITVAIVLVTSVIDRHRVRTQRAEQEKLRSQLAALHARLNPHFLFNSLNTVASLIAEDPEQAEQAVVRLSELLRHTLDGAKKLWVPLHEELSATRGYLDFEKLRYQDRLQLTFTVDPGVEEVMVPPLILQPLVENAVNHGIASREGGRVTVLVVDRGERLQLVVEDDGPGCSKHTGTQTSQADLRERLDLAYSGKATLDAKAASGGGYRVDIVVPKDHA